VIRFKKKPSSIKAELRRKLEIPGVPVVLEQSASSGSFSRPEPADNADTD
jgi:hypothetical protein